MAQPSPKPAQPSHPPAQPPLTQPPLMQPASTRPFLRRLAPLLRQAAWGAPALLLLWWVARTISWRAMWQTLANLQPIDLLWLAAANGAVVLTFTARWWLFLRVQGHRIPYFSLVRYRLTAFGISYFTPGPHFGGEPYQVYSVARRHNVPTSDALAAVALDKLLEMLVNFAFLAGGVLLLAITQQQLPPLLSRQLTAYAFVLLALPCLALVLLMLGRAPISGLLRRLGGKRLEGVGWLEALRRSEIQAIWLCQTHPRTVWAALGVSALSWLGVIGEFWLLTRLLDLPLGLVDAIHALVAARVATLLPLPAALGVLEAGQALAMSTLGLPPAYGVSIALLIRARDLLMGLIGLALGSALFWPLPGRAKLGEGTSRLPLPVPVGALGAAPVAVTPSEPPRPDTQIIE